MGNPAGVRRDFQALEQRRLLGARLLQQGVPQAEVARRVGVHRQSVSRWAQQLQRGGQRALKKAGRAGRRPRLRPEDLRRIERGLKRGPQALGYETSLWTSWRVAHLIEEECGVRYHASQAWRILHANLLLGRFLIDVLQICRLAAQSGAVVDDLAIDLSGSKVDKAQNVPQRARQTSTCERFRIRILACCCWFYTTRCSITGRLLWLLGSGTCVWAGV